MRGTYYETRRYIGKSGAVVEVDPYERPGRRQNWQVRFNTSRLVFTGFKSKFEALLFAAHKCRMSGERMNWEPLP